MVISPHGLDWISVGDSPLWLFHEGELRRLNAEASVLADEQIAGMPEAPLAEVVAALIEAMEEAGHPRQANTTVLLYTSTAAQ